MHTYAHTYTYAYMYKLWSLSPDFPDTIHHDSLVGQKHCYKQVQDYMVAAFSAPFPSYAKHNLSLL